MQGYCFNCKAQRNIARATLFTAKNGQLTYEGSCHTCGLAVYMYPPAARQAQAVGDEGGRTSGRPETKANAANYSQRAASTYEAPTSNRQKAEPRQSWWASNVAMAAGVSTILNGLLLAFVLTHVKEGISESDVVWGVVLMILVWFMVWGGIWALLEKSTNPEGWARTQQVRQQANQQRAQAQVAGQYSASPTAPGSQQVVEYQSYQDFDADRPRWLASGWHVASIDDKPQRAGIKRVVALGFVGALVWKPGAHVYVIYERQVASTEATVGTIPATPTARPAPISEELERLSALHERGALTDEEFEQAKRGVLGGT